MNDPKKTLERIAEAIRRTDPEKRERLLSFLDGAAYMLTREAEKREEESA
jgi:hypothetical protein